MTTVTHLVRLTGSETDRETSIHPLGILGWMDFVAYAISTGSEGSNGSLGFSCVGSHKAPSNVFFAHNGGCSSGSYDIGVGSTDKGAAGRAELASARQAMVNKRRCAKSRLRG